MTESAPDTWFKLRLSGPLRARLEGEASKRGITLTAEILRRIEETFSDTSARFDALEREVFDGQKGNENLSNLFKAMYSELRHQRSQVQNLEQELLILQAQYAQNDPSMEM
ncbi:hypothetical protein [Gluconobacter frateurii]|uniref:Arc-like DNA binding domain-containing protein n=1 Tax=Gluconobacter frateurii NRIC 0228 TaxID=1307946 RepID=A0ABQ0QDZ9_9PROT|nr:hypothetical protein [Gluconobacter frateurii]GBR15557.1 hypothetical protein AA0228_2545 [Gluconobacter frateurii NRIC 0228]